MRLFLPVLMSICLIFSGCTRSEPQPQPILLQTALDELVDAIVEDCELPMPVMLDGELMEGLLNADVEDMVQYRGYISMSSSDCDQLIGIEAKDGKAKIIAKKLEERLKFIIEDAKSGSAQKLEQAQAGVVYQKGNYLFLIVAGRPDSDPISEVAEITKRIEDNFSN